MPGFDRTGPMGEGSMTGGGFGQCTGRDVSGANVQGRGMRNGAGFGRGRGRGFGRGFNPVQNVAPNSQNEVRQEEFSSETISVLNKLVQRIEALEKKLTE